jgi:ubiquinone/menaquinone biosynthesis C-methylase UbiE
MFQEDNLKRSVQEKYTVIAEQAESAEDDEACGCGSGCGCGSSTYSDLASDYTDMAGYHPFADLGLGCGMPVEYAKINGGDTVVDLGSGAGNDCFVAREMVGEKGKVIGVDITERMVEKARHNAEIAGYNNVEFRPGDMEKLPLSDKMAHVILSNCSLNLVPEKASALREAYRVLKHHGQICISDIFTKGDLPKGLKMDADMYLGCMAGTLSLEEAVKLLGECGFEEITVHSIKKIELPDAMLHYYLPPEEAKEFREGEPGMYAVTLSAEKPCCHAGEEDHVCCGNH